MAVAWGLGFFLLSAVLLLVVGQLVQQRIADNPDEAGRLIVEELGFDVDDLSQLTVTDPSGTSITADQVNPLLLDVVAETRADIARRLFLVLPVLAVVAGFAGWWLAGRAARPILAVTAHARQVSSERLDARVDYVGPNDELRDLAHEFDVMMDRLEHAFTAQRNFAAAASHELRTPLTVIRTELDVALDAPRPTQEEIDEMAREIRAAISRSERVIDGLLTLARSGIVDLTAEADMGDVINGILDEIESAASVRDITVRKSLANGLVVWCDPVLLDRMIRNLVDNAILHNRDGGSIDIELSDRNGAVNVQIANTGSDLEEATVARLGEPFYRASSSRRVSGTGLGVAIARSIAESHGGQLTLDPRPGGGVIATIRLPATNGRPTSSH
jgi:signal transduction histidine kinase